MKVCFATLLTGTVVATLVASVDSSYQDAFLASTSKYVNAVHGRAACVITQAAQANRAWRLRTLTTAFSVAAAAAVKLTITDGASAVLWEEYVPAAAGTYLVPLPADPNVPGLSGGGLVNTPGNSMMVITLADGGGSVSSELNAEFTAA